MTSDMRRAASTIALLSALLLPVGAPAAGAGDANMTLTSRAVAFVRMLAAGSFAAAEAQFTGQMRQAAPPAKLREIWSGVESQVGAFQGTGDTRTVVEGGYTTVIVRTDFKQQALGIALAFDSAQRIAGMHFVPPP